MKNIYFIIALILIGIAPCISAEESHMVTGVITDENNDPLPGANVFVVGTNKGASTNLSGEYIIDGLASGTYEFRVSMMGYETTSQDVTIVADQKISFKLLPVAYISQPVIVTASRTRQKLQDSPMTTSVVEAEQIAERNFLSADEAMRFVPGVSMSDDQVSIRNSTGFAKGVGSRVLVMIDGVPILAGDTGEIKWDALPIGQVQQMEVVKSAGSALYGSNAMGGVINFITRRPEKKESYRVITEIGYWDKPAYDAWRWWGDDIRHYHRLSLEHARKLGNWGLLFNLEEKRNDSYRQADDYYRGQFFGKATCNLNGANKLSILTNIAYEDRGSGLAWKGQSAALEVDSTKLSDRVWSSKFQLNTVYDGSSDGGKKHWSVKGHINYNCWYDALSDGADGYDNHYSKSTRAGVDAQYTLIPFENHRFTSGTDLSMAIIDANIFGKRTGFGAAVYAQDEISTFDPIVATIGVRGDIFHVNSVDTYEGETYGQLNPKIGIVYHIADNIAARGNFGTGFRMPTMAELFSEIRAAGIINVQPNPYLKAEQAFSAEGGVNWIFGRQMLDVAVFNNWYSDMIEPVPTGVGNQVQFRNIQDANIFGVEASFKWNMGDAIRWLLAKKIVDILSNADFNASYLFTEAINVTESDSTGETVHLPYRPKHNFVIAAKVDYWKHGALIVDARYKSEFEPGLYLDDEVSDQRVIDVANKFTYRFATLQFKVSNLLNWNYTEIERNLAPIRSYSASLTLDF
ncbi:hypothetical protein DRQ36_00410 [bacterium]|nr:MAG: hypothetical protein DRQ36_00410 [bacterium]